MKKRLSFLTMFSLVIVMFTLSCAERSEVSVAVDCSGDAPTKQKKIKKRIEQRISNKEKLQYQYTNKMFGFEPVMEANGEATLYFWGRIYTTGNELEHVAETYEEMFKKACVSKVVFTPPPTMSAAASRLEFALCEAPNQVCPDGTCREDCVR
jgi:hypothetical protein